MASSSSVAWIGGQRGRRRFEDAPDRDQVRHVLLALEIHGQPEGAEQQLRTESGDVAPVALPGVDHAEQGQRPDGFPQRGPGQAQVRRQIRLRGQSVARRELSDQDHLPDPGDGVVGDAGPPGRPGRGRRLRRGRRAGETGDAMGASWLSVRRDPTARCR